MVTGLRQGRPLGCLARAELLSAWLIMSPIATSFHHLEAQDTRNVTNQYSSEELTDDR
jgi:hypothetical protein